MGLETEYVEYGIQLSLAILGVSATYLIQFTNPVTFLSLAFIPVLYGYTTYISHDGFNHATLASLTALIFSVLGGITAIAAVFFSVGNILVSALSGGTNFKDFYGATSIPLLISGLLIGATVFAYGTTNPNFKQDKIDQASKEIGEKAQIMFEDSGLLEEQKNSQLRIVNQTARTSVLLTTQKVINESSPSRDVRATLVDAETTVPEEMYRKTKERMDKQSPDISGKVENIFAQNFSGQKFILVIPLLSGLFYSLQPLIGLLTAFFAKAFLWFDS